MVIPAKSDLPLSWSPFSDRGRQGPFSPLLLGSKRFSSPSQAADESPAPHTDWCSPSRSLELTHLINEQYPKPALPPSCLLWLSNSFKAFLRLEKLNRVMLLREKFYKGLCPGWRRDRSPLMFSSWHFPGGETSKASVRIFLQPGPSVLCR